MAFIQQQSLIKQYDDEKYDEKNDLMKMNVEKCGRSLMKQYDEKYDEKKKQEDENMKIISIEAEKTITIKKKRISKSEACFDIRKSERMFKRSMKHQDKISCIKSLRPKLDATVDRDSNSLYTESSTAEPSSGGQ